MPNRYKDTPLEKAVKIIEWDGGTDFKGQLEYMAKFCGWDVIATYANHKAAQQSGQAEGGDRLCENCHELMSQHVGSYKSCKNGEWNNWGRSPVAANASR